MALAKRERLPRERLSEGGSRRAFAYGSIKLLPPPPQTAVVISKKTFATAPLRNRVRRRVSALLQKLIRTGRLTRGVVVYPNRATLRASNDELTRALLSALS